MSETVTRLLQRQILPLDRDFDVLPLYVDPEEARLDADRYAIGGSQAAKDLNNAAIRQSTASGAAIHPDQIESRTAQVARASTEQQAAIEALGSRVQRSSDLGVKNSEAIGGMAEAADQVFNQATKLREMVGQFRTGQPAVAAPAGNSKPQALEEPEALALSS